MEKNNWYSFKKHQKRELFNIFILLFLISTVSGQPLPFVQYLDHPWVDSVLATLSVEEQMAQSVWIEAGPDQNMAHQVETDRIIRQYGVGGLIIREGNAEKQAALINYCQSVSKVPLAIAMEGVWGPGFPHKMALGAVNEDSLLHRMGVRLAAYYKMVGVHVILSPAAHEQISATREQVWDALQENHILITDTASMGITLNRSLIEEGATDAEAVTQRARRILAFKYWAALHLPSRADGISAEAYSNSPEQKAFIRELYEHALTILNNHNQIIPLKGLEKKRIATIAINHSLKLHAGSKTVFQEMVGNYTRADHFCWNPGITNEDSLLGELDSYDVVLAAIYPGSGQPDLSGFSAGMEGFISSLSEKTRLISVCFDGPGAVGRLEALGSSKGLVLAYEQNRWTEELAAQLIFGGIGGKGRLAAAINESYPAGHGIRTPGHIRLQYGYPENAGVSSRILNHKIDSIVVKGLEAGAYPGCEVIAARKGMVIFHKTYGYHTYDSRIEVRKEDLYDLASVTKVSGPLSGLMLLESMGKFTHKGRLADYSPAMKGSDKADLELKDILAHRAGLYPWIPYWENTVRKNGSYKRRFLRYSASEKFSIPVAERVYLKSNYREKIYKEIRKSPLGEKEYLYSGLSFFLYPEMIETLSGERYEDFLSERIYHRLGAWDLVFNPRRFYPLSGIVPTEFDSLFRRQLVHGYVHDESAAMMGGFSGNAGLFSTANDLLKLFEMYRRMGSYGGEQIIAEEVLQQYSSYQFPELESRRGLGFDKPLLGDRDGTAEDYPCQGASPSSFGHSGFTGTFVWVDPEQEISYVFLSNRVHPTRDNSLLYKLDIRTSILQSLYDSIIE
ncbi:MAG: serine hydrolase [Bacteroidota bacterium]